MNRLLLIVLLGLVSLSKSWSAERPNILFIYTDDQSHRTVGCYPESYDWVKTPNIDRLAKGGVRFTHAYIGTWCMPSRATILTGHHQYGVESMKMVGPKYPASEYDPEQCRFWPSVFRKHGYVTAQIGKWHTGTDTGFGRDWDYQVVWNRPRYTDNAGNYFDNQLIETNGGPPKMVQGYTSDWYTDKAVDFIKGANRDEKKPWFLWLCFGAVHGPFTPAKRHLDEYPDPKVDIPADIYQPRDGKPAYVRANKNWIRDENGEPILQRTLKQRTVKNLPIHANTLQGWVRQYHQGVKAIDDSVGRLLKTLQETDQEKETLVVFAADQGLAWGQHGFQHKLAPYDANIRGPLIMRFPGRVAEGRVCKSPVGGTDIAPTFFSIAGLELPWSMHGYDLSPLLKDPSKTRKAPVLTCLTGEQYGSNTRQIPKEGKKLYLAGVPWWVSLMDGRYKYIRTLIEGEVEEIYDLQADPGELNNLALKPEYRGRLKQMREATRKELTRTNAPFAGSMPKTALE